MPRPLMQHGVGKLEEIFTNGKADAKLLKQLEHELQHRHVPRAVALLSEVQAAMHGGAAGPSQAPTVPATPPVLAEGPNSPQLELLEPPATPPIASPLASVRMVTPAVISPELTPVSKSPASPFHMPLEDAHKVLKATPGAPWESIEQTRRTLVHQSHPSLWQTLSAEKRAQALADAKRVNLAYAALSQTRCSGR